MNTRGHLVLSTVLRLLRPVVRLLLRHGVSYPALAAALKPVFLEAARAELTERHMAVTDSALTLLSGVHRRDVRRLQAEAGEAVNPATATATGLESASGPLSLAAEVAGRWLTDPAWADAQGRPLELPRAGERSFDTLVDGISRDVRPRAVLDEMSRLGVVVERDGRVCLAEGGFAPRQGFQEMTALFQANLHDHLAAGVANLQGDANFLEQAVYVDEITLESVQALQAAARAAWQDAMREVLREARERFDHDAAHAPAAQRLHRARFGVYFFSDQEDSRDA